MVRSARARSTSIGRAHAQGRRGDDAGAGLQVVGRMSHTILSRSAGSGCALLVAKSSHTMRAPPSAQMTAGSPACSIVMKASKLVLPTVVTWRLTARPRRWFGSSRPCRSTRGRRAGSGRYCRPLHRRHGRRSRSPRAGPLRWSSWNPRTIELHARRHRR